MRRMSRLILAGGGLLALTAPAFATIYYVDESSPPGTHPAPWNATVSLQTAMAAVQSLNNPTDLRAHQGMRPAMDSWMSTI